MFLDQKKTIYRRKGEIPEEQRVINSRLIDESKFISLPDKLTRMEIKFERMVSRLTLPFHL